MNAGLGATAGWVLAVLGVAAGYWAYGWPGVLLALSVVVFWLLLQFSQAMRLMRAAAQRPIGSVASAVMLHTRLQKGMRLADVMKRAGSFGQKQAEASGAQGAGTDVETFAWADKGGDAVHVTLTAGRVSAWELKRAQSAEEPTGGA